MQLDGPFSALHIVMLSALNIAILILRSSWLDCLQEPGSGIAAVVNGQPVAIGSRSWLARCRSTDSANSNSNGAHSHHHQNTNTDASWQPAAGVTRVHISVDGQEVGHIDLKDAARAGAAATVEQLRRRGVRCALNDGTYIPGL